MPEKQFESNLFFQLRHSVINVSIYLLLLMRTLGHFSVSEKDFTKKEWYSSNRLVKRQVLNEPKTRELVKGIEELFEAKVEIPRIRHGKNQTIETLINEEALLLAKYLRNEKEFWKPQTPMLERL